MYPDGSSRRQITHSHSGTRKVLPTWSPDSRKIAYGQIVPTAPPHVSVWIVDVGGANPHPLTVGSWKNLDAAGTVINTANDAGTPCWSPVGDTIVFWSGVENQAGQIWTIKSDGTSRTQLTHDRQNNDDPEFSPDGSKILYSTSINAGTLWVMRSDGSNQSQITNNTAGPFPGDASWQPIP
jgi:Tol biopolymer transport system component